MENNTFRIGKNEGTLKYISLDKVTDLDAPIRKGIDAVYEFSTPPPKYVVAEYPPDQPHLSYPKLR